jgi:signal transduction histidine kinase
MPFLAAFLPIVFLGMFSYQVASESVADQVRAANITAVSNAAQILTGDFLHTANLVHAIADVSGTVQAITDKDDLAMRSRLRAIVLAYPQIDRVFLTDPDGTLWTDYPQVPQAFGLSQADSLWYAGIKERGTTYISDVYVRPHDPSSPVVAIATTVTDASGSTLGFLVFEYRTEQIHRWLDSIRPGDGGQVFVLDGHSRIVAHPGLPDSATDRDLYVSDPFFTQIRTGNTFSTADRTDVLSGKRFIGAYQALQLGGNVWTVAAQQPAESAYAPLQSVRLRISLAAFALTIVTLAMVVALAFSERRNQRLNRTLQERNDSLRDLTSFVSHQLRAPVAAMRFTIESMLDGDSGPVNKALVEPLRDLYGVATQNGKLIDDILNVSRIDRGVIDVKTAPVTLKDIAERALRDYRVPAEKAGLSLQVEGADSGVQVLADAEKMAEAVTNAVSNAIKHTKKGGITLRLRSDGRFGYIDVADTGEGMTPEIMEKLFDRAGVKGSNTDSSVSTGLGLYIARNFMRLQKGDIVVMSEPGKGSTFTYSIPLA